MASQSFNLIGQEEEQKLVAFETRQRRGPTAQSRPSSRMEELFSQLFRSQDENTRSLESKLVENTRSLAENTRSLENKLVENTRTLESKLVENTRSLENK